MGKDPELRTPGEMLQRARRERGASLQEMAEITKIPERLLTAVEMDRYAELSGPLYIRSFLRTYARAVGLDPAEVLRRYERHAGGDEPESEQEVWHEETRVRRVGLPWRRPLTWLLGLLLLAMLILLAVRSRPGGGGRQAAAPVPAAPAVPAAPDTAAGADSVAAADTTASAAAGTAAGPAGGGATPAAEMAPPPASPPARSPAKLPPQERSPAARAEEAQAEEARMEAPVKEAAGTPPPAETREPAAAGTSAPPASGPGERAAAGLPQALPGDPTLVFRGGRSEALVLRVLGRGPVTVSVDMYGLGSEQTVRLPAAGAPPLPATGIVPGRVYAVREGWAAYWGTGRDGSFELKLSDLAGLTVTLNGRVLHVPASVVGRSAWLVDASRLAGGP